MRTLISFALFALSAAAFGAPLSLRPKTQAFEPNLGQCDPAVRFLARFPGYTLFLTDTEAVFVFSGGKNEPEERREPLKLFAGPRPEEDRATASVLRFRWIGPAGGTRTRARGLERLPGHSNYLRGKAPDRWVRDVPHYGRVEFSELFPGTDLVFYGRERSLEFDWRLGPGLDAAGLGMELSGQRSLDLGPAGSLRVEMPDGTFSLKAPSAYQEVGRRRVPVEARYTLKGGRVGFELGPCDPSLAVVIDPLVEWTTYLGGNDEDWPHAIAVDANGNAYIAGYTTSTDYPTLGAIRSSTPSVVTGYRDGMVSALDPTGSYLLYSTYLGGSVSDEAWAIVVDSSGSATVGGQTSSSDFPVVNAFQSAYGGSSDAFLCKLAPGGGSFIYSTYLGGSGSEMAWGLAQANSGDLYATGYTHSANFPVSAGFTAANGADTDAFVVKLSATGALLYSTCQLKGSQDEIGYAVAVDASGCAYVTGHTYSNDFPALGALQPALVAGNRDAFISKLSPTGAALLFSTYLGGSNSDAGESIAVDAAGAASVAGFTRSTNFPTLSPHQGANGGSLDGFVCKLSPTGAALVFSTYLGGSGDEEDSNLVLDSAGNIFVGTSTYSSNFPVSTGSCPGCGTGPPIVEDVVLSEYSPSGTRLFSSYFGSTGHMEFEGLDIDPLRNIYMTGMVFDSVPATAGVFQPLSGGYWDGFVIKFGEFYQSPSPTPLGSPTSTPTSSQSPTATPSASATPTVTPSATPTPSVTPSFSASPSFTQSPTLTVSPTITQTFTPLPTPTPTPLPLLLHLYPSSPNPSGGAGTWITFGLSTPALVSVLVYTVAGEEVVRLPSGDYPEGISEILWDNRNAAGTQVASGIYVFKVSAVSPANEQRADFGKCSVVR